MRWAAARNVVKTWLLAAIPAAVFAGIGWLLAGTRGAGLFAFASILGAAGAYAVGDRALLGMLGARPFALAEDPLLRSTVDRLAAQIGVAPPRLHLIDDGFPRAFAVGRNPRSSTLAVSSGLLTALTPGELEAVLAHELTHVKNRDVMVMTVASFFASIAAMITQFGFFFGGWGGGDDDDGAPAFAVVLLVSFAVYIISFFLMLALSRYREYAADRGSALITGNPSALASALLRISGEMQRVPDRDLRAVGRMNAFFIVPTSVKETVATLFMDHPPIEKRIARLEQYERELQGAAVAA